MGVGVNNTNFAGEIKTRLIHGIFVIASLRLTNEGYGKSQGADKEESKS
jgi:hypothetical protein